MAKCTYLTLEQHIRALLSEFCHKKKAHGKYFAVQVNRNEVGIICAMLIWNGFDDMEITRRQALVWKFIRKHLSSTELTQIGMIQTWGAQESVVADAIEDQKRQELPYL